MRLRRQKLEHLKFRVLDSRAREALRTMLGRLPIEEGLPKPSAPSGGGDAEWLLGELQRRLSAAAPPDSPASHFAVQLQENQLVLVQTQLGPEVAPPELAGRQERTLARIRRSSEATYTLKEVG